MTADLPCFLRCEGEKLWVSYCPVLGIYGQGETQNEAIAALGEAAETYVRLVSERNVDARKWSPIRESEQ